MWELYPKTQLNTDEMDSAKRRYTRDLDPKNETLVLLFQNVDISQNRIATGVRSRVALRKA